MQQTIDHGLGWRRRSATKVDLGAIRASLALAAVAVLVTATAAYLLNVRLFTSTESGLASLRMQTLPSRPRPVDAEPGRRSAAARW